jgi:N-formylmaleamate deformylase
MAICSTQSKVQSLKAIQPRTKNNEHRTFTHSREISSAPLKAAKVGYRLQYIRSFKNSKYQTMKKSKLAIGMLFISLMSLLFAHHHVHGAVKATLKTEVIGEGKHVLMIPGLTCDGAVWDSTIEAMGDGYQYHVLTLPGFAGNAPLEDLEAGFFAQVQEMVLDYIDKKGLEKPIIIGHSLGGFMALNIAIARPELPEKLVIVDALPFLTAIQMPQATAESAKGFAQSMKTQMAASINQTYAQRFAFQKQMLTTMINDQEQINIAADWGAKSDMPTVAQAMYEMYTTDIRGELDVIQVPTLVLGAWIAYQDYGVSRESNMANYKAQYAKLEGVQVDMTDKGNHFIMWDDPEFFNNWLAKFL